MEETRSRCSKILEMALQLAEKPNEAQCVLEQFDSEKTENQDKPNNAGETQVQYSQTSQPHTNEKEVPVYAELETWSLPSTSSKIQDEPLQSYNVFVQEALMQDLQQDKLNPTDIPADKEQTQQKNQETTRTRCIRKSKNQVYLDYLSDDELLLAQAYGYDTDSNVWSEGSESTTENSADEENRKKRKTGRKKSEKSKPDTGDKEHRENLVGTVDNEHSENLVGSSAKKFKRVNKRNDRKRAKNSGQAFLNSSGKEVPAKEIKPNPCSGKKCGNDCGSLTEERRKQIFDHFWKLAPERRKDWLVNMSLKLEIKRKRSPESQKRTSTFKYFINEGEGKRPVCLQFLCHTLDVSHKFIYYTLSNAKFGSAQEDLRGKCVPANKTKESTKNTVISFMQSLPALPSHYCRKDSTKVYLPQEFKNLSCLYQLYKNRYIEQGIDVVSERVFRLIFNGNFNIGFHVPKKDKCLKCIKFERLDKTDTSALEEKQAHLAERECTYNRFKNHQNIHKTNPETLCVSFDLQKVLNTPKGNSMLLYYSRKLAVYNLTFYESGTREVFCYYWDEVNGKRGANEIATILHRYITTVDERGNVKHLLLYCDCCPGQNRNRTVLAMINTTLQNCKFLQTIQINFLLTGHTYMPVDSVHAVIENNTKNSIIWAPSQWYTVFSTARQNPKPYNVESLTFKDFTKWDTISDKYFKGNLSGKISKIRIATFKKKEGFKIFVKYSMDDAAQTNTVEVQSKIKHNITVIPCFKTQLPISKKKYDDLNKLCQDKVIPTIFHQEFQNVPVESNKTDTLPDTDVEDEDYE